MTETPHRIDIGPLHPAFEHLRPTYELIFERFGILPSDLTDVSTYSSVDEPYVRAELSVLLPKSIKPEQLRERASRLLATANRLEQERASAGRPSLDAFTPTSDHGVVYVPPGEEPDSQQLLEQWEQARIDEERRNAPVRVEPDNA